ncbi:hypothetical protein B0H14DRAFT_3694396 [Mycena olivaceomarginata]|nr:hypothetical protein B0H14DRAFT_3694396 [Mycena olivaceomarginata]
MSDELGTLVIVVLKAKDLNDKYFWKQDVFAQVGLNGETKRTKVDKKGGQHPMWDEEIRLPIMKGSGDKFRKLDVSCWAQEPKKEDNIGQGYVDLTETLKTDWVKLESNGVSRGEIYLEMTFFTNAPAPVGHGLVVAQANLQRRPSKLSPADRLARPPYKPPSHRQQDSYSRHPNGLSPPSSRPHSNSPPRTGRESPLPPVPSHEPSTGLGVPSTLTPGRPKAQGTPQHVPSILRPRNPKSSPTPIPGPAVEYTGVIPAPEYGESSPPRTYTPVVPPPDSPSYAPHPPERWGSNDTLPPGGFSFPVPSIPGAREPTVEYSTSSPPPGNYGGPAPPLDRHGSGGSTSSFSPPPFQQHPPPPSFQPTPPPFQAPPPAFQAPPPSFQHPPPGAFPPPPQSTFHPQAPPPANNRNNDLPDPYLLARYQSPLPLPPGADKPSSHSQPALPPKDKDVAPAQSNPDNARLQALRQVEDETARRRAEEKREAGEAGGRGGQTAGRGGQTAGRGKRREEEARRRDEEAKRRKEQEDSARLRALKHAEDEAARRRAQEKKDRELALKQFADEEKQRNEQEERDRELARQLDRELNLSEAAAGSPPRIPGQW